jgi:hypothetical protein
MITKILMRLARPVFVRLLKECLRDKDIKALVAFSVKQNLDNIARVAAKDLITETPEEDVLEWIKRKL